MYHNNHYSEIMYVIKYGVSIIYASQKFVTSIVMKIPPTTPLGCPLVCYLHKSHNILHIVIFHSYHQKMISLPSILKHWKGYYNMMWCAQNQNMDQPMQIFGWKMPYLWQKLHQTDPCIHLGPTNRKPNIGISLSNLLTTLSPIPTNIIHYKIFKTL